MSRNAQLATRNIFLLRKKIIMRLIEYPWSKTLSLTFLTLLKLKDFTSQLTTIYRVSSPKDFEDFLIEHPKMGNSPKLYLDNVVEITRKDSEGEVIFKACLEGLFVEYLNEEKGTGKSNMRFESGKIDIYFEIYHFRMLPKNQTKNKMVELVFTSSKNETLTIAQKVIMGYILKKEE